MLAAPRIADADTAPTPSTAITETLIAGVPWYLWCAVLAVTSAYVGGYWDISWHRSIGRESFLSAPHLAIYACGLFAGITAGYLILTTTFGGASPMTDVGVRIWGLSGPLGAFICVWGGVAMLASAPFDDWWHNAYGLDVRIISPPHMVLAAGFFGIEFGTVMLMLAFMNRAALPGGAKAGTCAPRSDTLHPVGISAADHRAGVRDGSDSATHRRMAAVGPRGGRRRRVPRRVRRRTVAVCRLHADARGTDLVLWLGLSRFRHPRAFAAGALRILLPRAGRGVASVWRR